MASIRNLGLFPSNMCYPQVEELGWRINQLAGPTIELGEAPENAYLKLTREQAFFIFWRVKEWEITWQFDSANKSRNFTYTYPFPDIDGNIGIDTFEYVYSYPSKNTVITAPAQAGDTFFELQIPLSNEKHLVCQNIINPISGFNGFDESESTALNVQATETTSSNYDDQVFFSDASVNFINNIISINSNFNFLDLEQYLEIDTGIKNNLYYIPFIIDLDIILPTIGFLFDEATIAGDPAWSANVLPPIGGSLTSVPRFSSPSGTLSSYKALFFLTPEFNEPIEFDMYDITAPSPVSGTTFNLEGFTGITIRPKTYWPYDPNDGGGPIYDSATGVQLRPLPN